MEINSYMGPAEQSIYIPVELRDYLVQLEGMKTTKLKSVAHSAWTKSH